MPENELFYEISSLATEQRNPNSENIDMLPAAGILELINNEDMLVAKAVRVEIPFIAEATEKIVEAFMLGGRLLYFGAGTSGRLGIIDAAECPPTFGTDPDMIRGIIAGGGEAVFRAQEGAEDKPENGAAELAAIKAYPPDVVCGIAASGRTPFVKGAITEARKRGIFTILISTIPRKKVTALGIPADIFICPDVGPEVITGSTRMKSGTAQKLVLNMLTTAAMIRLGKTYGNVMVDLQLTNNKLRERAKKILMTIGGVNYDTAQDYLERSGGHVKTALVMLLGKTGADEARRRLDESGGQIKKALEKIG